MGIGIRHSLLEFPHDVLRLFQHIDAAVLVLIGLTHLAGGGCQAHDAGAHLRNIRVRQLEGIAVNAVKAGGDIPADLHVLLLVAAHRHKVRLIKQNIRRHQRGIGKQARVDIVRVLGRLVLELRHTAQLTEHGVAVQHPAKLGVGRNMGLHKQHVLLRVQTTGDIGRHLRQRMAAQIRRDLPHGDGMHIGQHIIAVIFIRHRRPVANRSKIRAQRQVAGGLDTA